jgi:hypothetical protein
MQNSMVQCCWQGLVCWWLCGSGPLELHKSNLIVQCCQDSAELMMILPMMVSPCCAPAKQLAAVNCPNFLLCFVVPVS